MITKCPECEREFDLRNEEESEEWHYGHDCEIGIPEGPAIFYVRPETVDCPDCGVKAGDWCRREGRTQPGSLLTCVGRLRAARTIA